MDPMKCSLAVIGLSCGGGGAISVERVVMRLDGVVRVYVNPATETAYVDYDPARTSVERIAAAIEALGYKTWSRAR